jgi:protein SCO1/2
MNRCVLLIVCVLLAASPLRAAAPRPKMLRDVDFEQRLNAAVPLDLPFRDDSGEDVALGAYFHEGRPVILVLAYYRCPMLCNLVLNGLTQALRDISFDAGREFEVVVVSFDPRESAELATEKKATYLKRYGREGADAGWHFLTGDQPAITRLTKAVGFQYRYDPERDEFAHASGIVLLTPGGRVSRYFYDVQFHPRDLRLGLVEASQSQIGSPIDRVLLFCFHYDPAEGKYGAAVMRFVRLGGVLTLLMVGAALWWLFRGGSLRSRLAGDRSPQMMISTEGSER